MAEKAETGDKKKRANRAYRYVDAERHKSNSNSKNRQKTTSKEYHQSSPMEI